jgi:hypothetical protein
MKNQGSIMQHINFNPSKDSIHHKCESIRRGDWIIFRCPRCKDYERRINWRTGEMKSKGAKAEIHHTGNYFPHEFRDAFENVN